MKDIFVNKMDFSEYIAKQIFYYGIGSALFFPLIAKGFIWTDITRQTIIMLMFTVALVSVGVAMSIQKYRNNTTLLLNTIIGFGLMTVFLYFKLFPVLVGITVLILLVGIIFIVIECNDCKRKYGGVFEYYKKAFVMMIRIELSLMLGVFMLVAMCYRIHVLLLP